MQSMNYPFKEHVDMWQSRDIIIIKKKWNEKNPSREGIRSHDRTAIKKKALYGSRARTPCFLNNSLMATWEKHFSNIWSKDQANNAFPTGIRVTIMRNSKAAGLGGIYRVSTKELYTCTRYRKQMQFTKNSHLYQSIGTLSKLCFKQPGSELLDATPTRCH
jgi:hypothetical protein